jgi:hypothetical protein
MSGNDFLPLSEEDRAAFIATQTPTPEPAAVVVPEPVAPVATPAAEPAADPSVERLSALEEQTRAATDQLTALVAQMQAAKGKEAEPVTPGLIEQLADESEGVRALGSTILGLQKTMEEIRTGQQTILAREAKVEEAERTAEYEKAYTAAAQALLTKYPGLGEKDFNTLFSWLGDDKNQDIASRMNLEQVAALTLGVDYLSDRRRTPSPQPSPSGSPPARGSAPATLVDTTVPGGALPRNAAPPAGSLRDACDEIARTSGHLLGKQT